jgi:drug/metabolite transporter (DMT)-like permease
LRLLLAGLLLTVWTFLRGEPPPRGPALRAAIGYGACQFGINFPLLYWAEQVVPSGLAAVCYATVPLSSALMTRAFGMEPLTAPKLIGAVTALAGVGALFSSSLRGEIAPGGLAAILVAATVSGLGSILLKRGPRQSPTAANAVACGVGAAMSLAISFARREPHHLPATLAAAGPILYLTVAGSLGAFVIMSWLIHHWSVTRASYVSVIVPVLALALGSLVRHERLTWLSLAGSVLVVIGLLIGMRDVNASVRARAAQS